MDIFTNDNIITIEELKGVPYVGLKINARNAANREIAFLARTNGDESTLILNLGDLSQYPDAPPEDITPTTEEVAPIIDEATTEEKASVIEAPLVNAPQVLKHLKIEIEYILTDVEFTQYTDRIFMDRIVPKRYSAQYVKGRIHPEFYLSLPEGWRMGSEKEEGGAVQLVCFIKDGDGQKTPIQIPSGTDVTPVKLKLIKPVITQSEGRRKYNYLVDKDSFSALNAQLTNKSQTKFKFSYQSQLGINLLACCLIFPAIFIAISASLIIFEAYKYLTTIPPFLEIPYLDIGIAIPLFIALLAYSSHLLNTVEKGYEILYKKTIVFAYIITLVSIVIIIFIRL